MTDPEQVTPASGTLRLQLYKSPIGYNSRQKATVHALGLRRLHQVVVQSDSPVTRGMVSKVPHLVRILDGAPPSLPSSPTPGHDALR